MNNSSTIRVNRESKENAKVILDAIGIDLTTAVNVYLREIARCGGIPFALRADVPNAETMAAIEEAERGIGLHGPFQTVAELMEDLNADD